MSTFSVIFFYRFFEINKRLKKNSVVKVAASTEKRNHSRRNGIESIHWKRAISAKAIPDRHGEKGNERKMTKTQTQTQRIRKGNRRGLATTRWSQSLAQETASDASEGTPRVVGAVAWNAFPSGRRERDRRHCLYIN